MTAPAFPPALLAMDADLSRPFLAPDGEAVAAVRHAHLQRRVLETYRRQIGEGDATAQLAWLLERVASLEARILALQSARQDATPRPGPAPTHAADANAGTPEAVPGERVQTVPDDTPGGVPAAASAHGLVIHADEDLPVVGFYATERDAEGRPFRWLGPDVRARLFLPRVSPPFEVRLHLRAVFAPAALERTRVSVDGGAWTPAHRDDRQGAQLRCRPAPGPARDPQVMNVDLDVGVSASPTSRGVDDKRMLSIALQAIEIAAVDPAG